MYAGINLHQLITTWKHRSKLGLLYEHLILQAFSLSIVTIYIPIYLFLNGFSIQQVFMYLLIEWVVVGLFAVLWGGVIHKFGIKEVVYIRTFFTAIVFVMLYYITDVPWIQSWFLLIPVLNGIVNALYTISTAVLFSDFVGQEHQGLKTAKFIAYPQLATILGPLSGGFIALTFGFHILFIIATVGLLISITPLSFLKGNIDHPVLKTDLRHEIIKNKSEFFAINGFGVEKITHSFLVPLGLYFSTSNTFEVGSTISVILFIGALTTYLVGKMTEKSPLRVLWFGTLATSFFFFMFGFFLLSHVIFAFALFSGLLAVSVRVPYETFLFDQARRNTSPLGYVVYKEFAMTFGRVLLFAPVAFGFMPFYLVFVSAGILTGFLLFHRG